MRFSEYFDLALSQYELDFVDIPLETDIELFIDPYAIAVRNEPWFTESNNVLVDYFNLVLAATRAGRDTDALWLLRQLKEPNQTHFGLSHERPAGRSIGSEQSLDIFDRLKNSRAVETGFLQDLADCELVIPGIARDKISDITTNIIKIMLIAYTSEQCELHKIPMQQVPQRFWHPPSRSWQNDYVPLPIVDVNGQPEAIILVPKIIARLELAYNAGQYYRHFVLTYLQAEHVEAGTSLVRVLKNGRKVVYKKDLQEMHPYSKEFLYEFSRDNPRVFEDYKNAVTPAPPIQNEDIEAIQRDPKELSLVGLCDEVKSIPPGNRSAEAYHQKILGILKALFYPHLWKFIKEQEINTGRKRVDIVADNYAREGFFFRLNSYHNIQCPYVFFECKNYSSDPANPELDQLNGRLSPRRGKFGMLFCRKVENKSLMLDRCRDVLHDHGSYLLVLDDDDVCALLEMKEGRGDWAVFEYLDDLLRVLLL